MIKKTSWQQNEDHIMDRPGMLFVMFFFLLIIPCREEYPIRRFFSFQNISVDV
jgi:hypothetical protein